MNRQALIIALVSVGLLVIVWPRKSQAAAVPGANNNQLSGLAWPVLPGWSVPSIDQYGVPVIFNPNDALIMNFDGGITKLWNEIMHGTLYQTPDAAPYLPTIEETELKQGIPSGLLYRLLYQESHFRPDIISGETVSAAGAVGIAQIVPKWHPGINAYDPIASIKYAGQYLRSLYNQFGDWGYALAAYNWGPSNVKKAIQEGRTLTGYPLETRNYVVQIMNDVPSVSSVLA